MINLVYEFCHVIHCRIVRRIEHQRRVTVKQTLSVEEYPYTLLSCMLA